jgi:hypothetical protein
MANQDAVITGGGAVGDRSRGIAKCQQTILLKDADEHGPTCTKNVEVPVTCYFVTAVLSDSQVTRRVYFKVMI